MRIHVLVEEESGRRALESLLKPYRAALGQQGHGLSFIHYQDKQKLLKEVGPRAAQLLANNPNDCAVALPDLQPVEPFARNSRFAHSDLPSLQQLLKRLVKEALGTYFPPGSPAVQDALRRFHPSAFKYEMEMLLLAAWRPLGQHLGVELRPDRWRHPVEEQDHSEAGRPRSVVGDLFRTRTRGKRAYRATVDAPAVLSRVADIRSDLLYSSGQQLECPVFKGFLDWLAKEIGVAAY